MSPINLTNAPETPASMEIPLTPHTQKPDWTELPGNALGDQIPPKHMPLAPYRQLHPFLWQIMHLPDLAWLLFKAAPWAFC